MNEQLARSILDLATPLVHSLGLIIWGLDVAGSPPALVRLYVDLPQPAGRGEAPAGEDAALRSPSIEQCEEISRQLGLALDVADDLPGPWVLEVSTPGLERKFFDLAQMAPYVGDVLEVSLLAPLECGGSRKHLQGRLLAVDSESFEIGLCQIHADGRIVSDNLPACAVPWAQCRSVRRLYVFTPPQKPGKGASSKKSH